MSRPSIPRPNSRPAPAVYPAPVMREKLETLELIDDDIVESQVVRKTAPPPLRKTPSVPPPPRSEVKRISVIDPIDVIFEGLSDLGFAETMREAAALCARALAKALGAKAVLVHAHDQPTEEIRVIGGYGAGTSDLFGVCAPTADDFVADGVLCNQKAMTMRFDGEVPRFAPRRVTLLGANRSLVAVPTNAQGRCAAIIEVFDADETYQARVADAASYVAGRLAEYLAARAAA